MSGELEQQASQILQAMRDATPVVTEALVQLTFAQGIGKLAVALMAFLVLLFAQLLLWNADGAIKRAEKGNRHPGDAEVGGWVFCLFGGSIVSLISVMVGSAHLVDGLIYIIAPEGQTIMNVIEAMRGAVR